MRSLREISSTRSIFRSARCVRKCRRSLAYADDRLGLLYDATRTIGEQGLEIYISKAATIRDQVTDTFYLKDGNGEKVKDPKRLEQLREALLEAVRGSLKAPSSG